MASVAWTRSLWTDAALLAADIDSQADIPETAHNVAPHIWYDGLVAASNWTEAIAFLAHALPRYECVVWATRVLLEANAIDRHAPATVAIMRWIDQPSDQLRRDANDAVQELRDGSPLKMLGQAVFYSGGSISPPEFPAVLPPTGATAKLVTASLLVALLKGPDVAEITRALKLGERFATGEA